MRAKPKLRVEQVALAEMRPAPWNPRTITDFQLEALQHSLEEFGAVEPVVLNADGLILGGHQRYAAARALGWDSLPAVRLDLDEESAKLLNLALNRISGEWDTSMLAELVSTIDRQASEFVVAGFPSDEVERLLASLDQDAPPEFPEVDATTDHQCPSCHYQWSGPCR